jgi:AraC family transcriptional regulator
MLYRDGAPAGAHMRKPTGHRAATEAGHYQAVHKVIGAMRERLDDEFSLNDMADVAIMSPFHFNRTFREITGVPPCHFLGAIRLETAKRLLVTTQLSVTDVCFEVGYNSLGTFTRRFTDLLGVSPRRFRRMAHAPLPGVEFGARDPRPVSGASFSGRVTAPEAFSEPIFIGLFRTPSPEGRPLACALLRGPGPYRITDVPDGRFYLFGAGVRWSGPREYLLHESAVRGGGQSLRVSGGMVSGSTDLVLREPALTDPPMLVTFPLLLARSRQIAPKQPASLSAEALAGCGVGLG